MYSLIPGKSVSSSKLDSLTKCLYSMTSDVVWHEIDYGDVTKEGTDAHEVFENLYTVASDAIEQSSVPVIENDRVLKLTNNWIRWFHNHRDKYGRPSSVLKEVGMAYDCVDDAGRIIESKGQRDYTSVKPCEVPGTCDLIEFYGDNEVNVIDYKTGRIEVEATTPQILLMCLCIYRVHPNLKTFRAIIVQPSEFNYEVREHIYTVEDIEMFSMKLMGMYEDLLAYSKQKKSLVPVVGSHCSKCSGRFGCPAMTETANTLVPATSLVKHDYKLSLDIQNEDHLLWLVNQVPLAKKFLDQIERKIKDEARARDGIETGDGYCYKPVPSKRTGYDDNMLIRLARQLGATNEQVENCLKTTTFETMKRVKVKK